MSWFYMAFTAAGLYQARQPSRGPPCSSHNRLSRHVGQLGLQDIRGAELSLASLGLMFHLPPSTPLPVLLNHHQTRSGYFLSPLMSEIPMLRLKLESWAHKDTTLHQAQSRGTASFVQPLSGSAG